MQELAAAAISKSDQFLQQRRTALIKGHQLIFVFCLPCISSQILVNNQPDAHFHVFIYSFHPSTCFEHQVFIIRRSNFINTSFGMISLCKWLLGMPVRMEFPPDRHTRQSLRLIIPDYVLIQFDLLMSTWCSKHVERWNE